MKYDLDHLTQPETQHILGPIQDDEALFIFGLIRTMRLSTVLELGGGFGYSSLNFLKAIGDGGKLYSVDFIDNMNKFMPNQTLIKKRIKDLTKEDIDCSKLDLVFFDCHDEAEQLSCFKYLVDCQCITDETVLMLHDTNVHPFPVFTQARKISAGYIHQIAERRLVNFFSDNGYHVFNAHTNLRVHDEKLPYRHGITICQKFKRLEE